jgi:uncharacterized protein
VAAELEKRFRRLSTAEYPGGLVVIEATSFKARLLGLSLLGKLDSDHALHIPRCSSIHMFGMRFALDLIWLDRQGGVVRVDRGVRPWRIAICRGAKSVVETVAGRADAFVEAGVGRSG